MNEAFEALGQEKKSHILRAAMEVFSQHEYSKASTDEIAAKAGISKGLLFYYFHNKRELYHYVYRHCIGLMAEQLRQPFLTQETDLFEMLFKAQSVKLRLLRSNPFLAPFIQRAYYSAVPQVSGAIQQFNTTALDRCLETILERADLWKFKEGVSPRMVLNLILWSGQGYLQERIQQGNTEWASLETEFRAYLQLLRGAFYKEEALP